MASAAAAPPSEGCGDGTRLSRLLLLLLRVRLLPLVLMTTGVSWRLLQRSGCICMAHLLSALPVLFLLALLASS